MLHADAIAAVTANKQCDTHSGVFIPGWLTPLFVSDNFLLHCLCTASSVA